MVSPALMMELLGSRDPCKTRGACGICCQTCCDGASGFSVGPEVLAVSSLGSCSISRNRILATVKGEHLTCRSFPRC